MGEFKVNDFKGVMTWWGRGNRPVGSFDDAQNLVLEKTQGKLAQRGGYHVDTAGSFTSVDGTVMTFVYEYFPISVIWPQTTTVEILFGIDGSSNQLVFQKPWWDSTGLLNDTWLKIGESKSTTINVKSDAQTISLTAGSTANDYYNGWIIYNTTRSTRGWVTDYTGSTKTAILRTAEATSWANGDSITLYRHSHDAVTLVPLPFNAV